MIKFEIPKIKVEPTEINGNNVDTKETVKEWDLDKPICEQIDKLEEKIEDYEIISEIEDIGNLEDWDLDKPILEQMGINKEDIEKTDVAKSLEDRELFEKDIDEKQKEAIETFENGDKDEFSNAEKGNYGEMKTDQELKEKGYERISKETVEGLDHTGSKGIDGVYYNPEGDPKIIIVESKYGSSKQGETADGKQMSENWIDNRLDDAVGKEMADEIRMADPDDVGSYISHIDSDGNVSYDKLDSDGNIIQKDVEINA